jgi:MOSC domain-containing protein YiiM
MAQAGIQAKVVGIFSGPVESFIAGDSRPMTSGIRKRALLQGVLAAGGFVGDESTEADHHTPDRSVHIFPDEHYGVVEARLALTLPRPAFGENLTVSGALEDDVFVGDRYRIGSAVVCITQPTERCKAIGRSIGAPKILKVLHDMEACGYYARVVEPGAIEPGDKVELCDRPQSAWSIRDLHRVMFQRLADASVIAEVLAVAELSVEWKRRIEIMRERHSRGEPLSSSLAELHGLSS